MEPDVVHGHIKVKFRINVSRLPGARDATTRPDGRANGKGKAQAKASTATAVGIALAAAAVASAAVAPMSATSVANDDRCTNDDSAHSTSPGQGKLKSPIGQGHVNRK